MSKELIELDIDKLLKDDYLCKDDYYGDSIFAKEENHDIDGFNYSVYFKVDGIEPTLYLECDLKEEMVSKWKK